MATKSRKRRAQTRGGAPRARRGARRGAIPLYIWGIVVSVLVVGLLIGLEVATQGGGGDAGGPLVIPSPRDPSIAHDGLVLGSPNAPVTITEYLDFQCPFCSKYAVSVLPSIEETYISKDQAKLEVRPMAILGPESELAAQAAYAANDQGRFWDFYDMLFANQKGEGQGRFSLDNLKRMAAAIGLDTNAFNSAMDSKKYESKVKSDTSQSQAGGVRGTPTVFVNGRPVQPTLEATKATIDQELAAGR